MKNKFLRVLLIAALVLLVPFLIGRVSVIVLDRVYPAIDVPAFVAECREKSISQQKAISQLKLDCMRQESDYLIQSLNRTRNITKITLAIIGVYYIALIAVWLIRRRKRKSADQLAATQASQPEEEAQNE